MADNPYAGWALIVVDAQTPFGSTNLIRVHRLGEEDHA